MVESIADFSQIQMKEFFRDSPVGIEPMLCITPESFDPVNMVSALGTSPFLANHYVLSPNSQRCISLPLIRIVQTPWIRMLLYQRNYRLASPSLHGKDLDSAIAFENAKNNDLASCAPATLAFAAATKCRFITLKLSMKALSQSLFKSTTCPDLPVKSLGGWYAYWQPESLSIYGNSQHKQLKQSVLRSLRQTVCIPYTCSRRAMSACLAFVSSVCYSVRSAMSTFFASFHAQTSLPLVRFVYALPFYMAESCVM